MNHETFERAKRACFRLSPEDATAVTDVMDALLRRGAIIGFLVGSVLTGAVIFVILNLPTK